MMNGKSVQIWLIAAVCLALVIATAGVIHGQQTKLPDSYAPVSPEPMKAPFDEVMKRMIAEKPAIMKRQMDLLETRYDLSDKPAKGVTMFRGKPVQEGVRIKLPQGMTWEKLAQSSSEEIREKDLWPAGFYPLPHPNHPEGGMLFPKQHIDEIKKQEARTSLDSISTSTCPSTCFPSSRLRSS